ncbi:aminotransferase class III-fold pyridoxal phosphate-dependent enzyme [Jiella pelagia]|uniref:Aminotransferase class III-fold pyridoxal phosphate-dependent enzyme n=1 Tax=Jiella pelagia TaxID=2986949 RepID=A0ABY7CC48_9HYPH|nr:aminotransferase class III-fold pyridoxal phosphate-dependent enzyme [Jiella pelagia]WAP71315.1 aminotransferase class III-fold pyridoxal phosphate-dependent enzyme [Jiella pelagia]
MPATPTGRSLFHGYTYSAHPAACAAALATLNIFRDEKLFERAKALSPLFLEAVFGLRNLPQITDLRGYGMMAGIQLKPRETPGEAGSLAQRRLFDAGLHVKATGDALIVAPAFVTTEDEIGRMIEVLQKVLGRAEMG